MTTSDPFASPIAGLLAGTARRAIVVDTHHTITLTRHFDTDIHDLWEACTSPERLKRWIGELRGDPELAGRVELVMSPPCDDIATLTIAECREPDRLRVVWSFPAEVDTEVRLMLRPVSSVETLLTLEHAGLDRSPAIGYGAGWEDFLARLDAVGGGADPATVDWPDLEAAFTPVWTAVVDVSSAVAPAAG